MTQEDKELLLKDLCGRLPYGFIIHRYSDNCDIVIESNGIDAFAHFLEYSEGEDFKPYLRPMYSMTEEEKKELNEVTVINCNEFEGCSTLFDEEGFDWLNAHHFDYRGLIKKGLAIEAKEGIYEEEKA